VCKVLLAERAQLSVHDPRVSSEAIGMSFTDQSGAEQLLSIETDPYLACVGAHAILVLTEWDQFTRLDFRRIYEGMQRPAFVFDGHNLLNHDELREIGFSVFGIGKPHPSLTKAPTPQDELAAKAQAARVKVGAARASDEEYADLRSSVGSDVGVTDLLSSEGKAGAVVMQTPERPATTRMTRADTFGGMA